MTSATPNAELFGFSEPIVKNGEVFVPLRTVGGFARLHGRKGLLVDLAHAILHATGAPTVTVKAEPSKRVSGKGLGRGCWMTAERRQLLDAALRDWEQGNRSQPVVAAAYGISLASLVEHRQRVRREVAEGRRPVTKPSGAIL